MAEELEVAASLANEKVLFHGVSKFNPANAAITFDYKPPLGDGKGYTGLELLLMSLAGCSGTSMVYLLRKMGKTVSGLTVNARGTRRDQPPLTFQKILLEFDIRSPDAEDGSVERAIRLCEESVCPVWQMVKNNVEVETQHAISAP